jgi:membrane protease YdiL (CAAX protease family)
MIIKQTAGESGLLKPRRRFRYLIDIVVLVLVSLLLEDGAAAIYRPSTEQSLLVFGMFVQLLAVGAGWFLIRLRGDTLADIGLKRPRSWWRTIAAAVLLAAVIFALIYLSERMGFRRDLSRFKAVQGNLELTSYAVLYALIGAGFYEEFMFRGFLFQALAMLFGGSRRAWIVACVVQGLLFGLAHSYQNPIGIAITGTLGIVMGFVVLASGRNLWLVIIGHGLFDASRFVLFYFQGTS